ncbi:MAG TPA: nucleoside hydrolase [Chthoniobacterales bacterium]
MGARWWINLGALLLALAASQASFAAKTVWIDTDVSIGSPIREADDGFALVAAFHSPELRIAGISTTYGNASLAYVDRTAREIAQRFGKSANLSARDVYAGASSAGDLARPSAAADALAAAVDRRRIIYIALGPLTNLATALKLHPQIRSRIERIVFVGGVHSPNETRFGAGNWLRVHDANVFKDPAAAAVVLRSKIPILLVPISVAGRLTLNREDLGRLRASDPAGSYLAHKSAWWSAFWLNFVRSPGAPVFDALALMAAARPELVRSENQEAYLNSDRALIVTNGRPDHVRCCKGYQARTKELLMRRLLAR